MKQDCPRTELPIALFLQHYAAQADQRLVCSIASVCKEWNMAVQHANTAALSIIYEPLEHKGVDSLCSFAKWLAKYARLVSSIEIGPGPAVVNDIFWWGNSHQFRNIASPLLQQSVQAAAEKGLKLRSFTAKALLYSKVWQALPGASLTRLELQACELCTGAELTAALPQLPSVEVLDLMGCSDMPACLPALYQLSKLTSLTLGHVNDFDTRQLPTQLRRLRLRLPQQRDLAHLTSLTSLAVSIGKANAYSMPDSAVPEKLIELTIECEVHDHGGASAMAAFHLTRLGQLERLTIHNPTESGSELLQLTKLPRLQKLALHVEGWSDKEHPVYKATSVWPQVRLLQDLVVDPGGLCLTRYPSVLGDIAACTALTQLTFASSFRERFTHMAAPAGVPVDLCKCVSRLHNLQELDVKLAPGATFWSGQAQYLRPLTSLTKLCLTTSWGEDQMLTNTMVDESLQQLKQLQWLRVSLPSCDVLPVIGSLTKLRHLVVDNLASDP